MKHLLLSLLAAMLLGNSFANNVQITGVTSTVNAGFTTINFNISWDNSWKGGPAGNYDAVWVFIKVKGERLTVEGKREVLGSKALQQC